MSKKRILEDMNKLNEENPTEKSDNNTAEPPVKKLKEEESVDENKKEENGNTSRPERKNGKKDRKRGRNKYKGNHDTDDNGFRKGWIQRSEYRNKDFEYFYRQQPFFKGEHEKEMDEFLKILKESLPITFRINRSNPYLMEKIKNELTGKYIKEITSADIKIDFDQYHRRPPKDGAEEIKKEPNMMEIKPPSALSFIPDDIAWQVDITKAVLRKHPVLNKLRQYIVNQSTSGNITRQEAVSMLPPILFDINPEDQILDMCAAPGSKTSQLMEGLLESGRLQNKPVSGFVVANDNDVKRCYLLITQLQRLTEAIPNLIVTCHDATQFPDIYLKDDNTEKKKLMKFDKILCDVMCSGDGTIRKAPDIWKRWTPKDAIGLHEGQFKIGFRASKLLKTGGMMVYSTCSMNPIEDEAVVARLLRESKGTLELVDCSEKLKNLKYSKGLTDWVVTTPNNKVIKDESETEAKRVVSSMFPPTEEEAKTMNLHYCARILPHYQNTGGFFICLLRKIKPTSNDVIKSKRKETKENLTPTEKIKEFKGRSTSDEMEYKPLDTEELDKLYDFYKIPESIVPRENLRIRTAPDDIVSNASRRIYFISDSVRNILDSNKGTNYWKIVNAGLRAFQITKVTSNGTKYRITQEGAEILHQHIDESRKLQFNKSMFLKYLSSDSINREELEDEEHQKKFDKMDVGGICIEYIADKKEDSLVAAGLRSENAILRHISKDEIKNFLYRIGDYENVTQV